MGCSLEIGYENCICCRAERRCYNWLGAVPSSRILVLDVSCIMDARRAGNRISQKAVSLSAHVLFKEIPVFCRLSQLITRQSCRMLQIVHYCICPLLYVYMRPGFYHFSSNQVIPLCIDSIYSFYYYYIYIYIYFSQHNYIIKA